MALDFGINDIRGGGSDRYTPILWQTCVFFNMDHGIGIRFTLFLALKIKWILGLIK